MLVSDAIKRLTYLYAQYGDGNLAVRAANELGKIDIDTIVNWVGIGSETNNFVITTKSEIITERE